MATNAIVFIKDVKARKRNTSLRVRVANLWRKKMNGAENKTYRLDMILMDEMGDFIYANCMHTMLERFDSMLHIDETLYINNPFISKDDTKQHVDYDKKMSLNDKTTIIKCQNWEGPKFAFNFLCFKTLNQKTMKHNTKTDFIGYVKVCYNLDFVKKKNGIKAPIIKFKLRNLEGIEIDGSLWEDKAIALSSFMSNPDRDPHVFLLVQFASVNNYQGNMSVKNSYEASRVFINEDIEELRTFKQQYLAKFVDKESSESSNSTVGSYMISNETKVIIVGKISEIGTDLQWYYKGCNYFRAKVEKKFVSYEKDDGTVGGKEVKARFLVNRPAVDEVADINEDPVAQLEEVIEQDTMSSTNADESEMSRMKKIVAEDESGSSKRPVDDVYEVDGPTATSITKRKKVTAKEGGTMNNKMNLLIPKLEK
ncbi:hypothetical protein M8C21_023796 [Ambrosia artemisiifolia]|uniref:Replication protein A 70 kDa DNA-binding subunit B/D first OB fold domain-containing protein n=1 Tax=Ambrosia artemisiifolia TaxID=4212 RepID=A0AAD5GAY6_AMBAR|nr:hypothetical protein M8C21_023796 [Ambrosia artemisiifolia]